MKNLALVVLGVAGVAYAQNSTTGIPTNVSAGCLTFLNGLNVNPQINNCLTALVNATSDFDPTTHSAVASTTAVDAVLNNICISSFNACDASAIRSMLSSFYADCQTDLLGAAGDGSNGNRQLIELYDVLYVLMPLKNAICTRDGNDYCMHKIASTDQASASTVSGSSAQNSPATDTGNAASSAPNSANAQSSSVPPASSAVTTTTAAPGSASGSASSSASTASSSATHARRSTPYPANSLYRRADNTTDQETLGTVAPEVDQYNSIGLPYLFLTANLTDTQLCTTCTAEVVGQYIQWETITPYALGIANSPLLSGQVTLWNKIKTCPGNYASDLLNNATDSVTGNSSSSSALASVKVGVAQVASALVAVVVGGVMLF